MRIDLKTKEGLEQAAELVRDADVLVENFAPGVMERLGLSKKVVKKLNPRCIYLSMPGFRSDDEVRAELKAFEAIIMTESGVFADMGLNRTLMGINPSYSPLPLASTYAAPMAANAVTAALIRREVTGIGDFLEVPLAACLHDTLVRQRVPSTALASLVSAALSRSIFVADLQFNGRRAAATIHLRAPARDQSSQQARSTDGSVLRASEGTA